MPRYRLFITTLILTLLSCGRKKTAYTYQLSDNKDTINIIDHAGLRQGIWLMPNSKDTMVYCNDTGYSTSGSTTTAIIEMLSTKNFAGLDSVKKQAKKLREGYYQ